MSIEIVNLESAPILKVLIICPSFNNEIIEKGVAEPEKTTLVGATYSETGAPLLLVVVLVFPLLFPLPPLPLLPPSFPFPLSLGPATTAETVSVPEEIKSIAYTGWLQRITKKASI